MNISKGWYCCSSAPAWKKNLKARVWCWWVYFFSCSPPTLLQLVPHPAFLSYFSFSCTHFCCVEFEVSQYTFPAPSPHTPHGPSFLSHIPHWSVPLRRQSGLREESIWNLSCPRLAPSSSSPCESTFTSENAKITVLMALWIRNSWNISNISQQKSRVIENKWWQESNREIGKGNLGLYGLRQKKERERDNKARRQEKRSRKRWKAEKMWGQIKEWTNEPCRL